MRDWRIIQGDALEVLHTLEDESVHCCITSPPYWGLRDYGIDGQFGLERTPEEYVEKLVEIFREVRRVLRDDGTVWLNLGDSYTGTGPFSQKQTDADIRHAKVRNAIAKIQRRVGAVENLKPKNLIGIPWRVAFALQADGWWLRSDIIWSKPSPMPESVTDRPTKAHEYIFLLAKNGGRSLIWRAKDTGDWSSKPDLTESITDENGEDVPRWRGFDYYYDADAVREPNSPETQLYFERYIPEPKKITDRTKKLRATGKSIGRTRIGAQNRAQVAATLNPAGRNKRSVWNIATHPYPEAHFATFPPKLIEPMILAGCPIGGTVLDPFAGTGTTGLVALRFNRKFIGIELNPEYVEMAKRRIKGDAPLFNREKEKDG